MKRITSILAALTILGGSALAETPLWLRSNSISPDGKSVAFSYKGDIFTVDAAGGQAKQITSNKEFDGVPKWTPDSKNIVFVSYREGSKDIFITSAQGGVPRRLTEHPLHESLLGVTPDGTILFSSNITADQAYGEFPGDPQLYGVSSQGGRPWMVTPMTIGAISVNKDGLVLYEDIKGYEDPFRKHHTSSVTRDIWLYKPVSAKGAFSIDAKGEFKKLTSFVGEDREPVFGADGDTFYYLSEQDGTLNIWRSSISAPDKAEQLSFVSGDPIRYLSVSQDGTLCYSYKGELYTMNGKLSGKDAFASAKKIAIDLIADNADKSRELTLVASGVSSFAASPNGKEVAVVTRGDVYVTTIELGDTKRITNTPEQERGVSFSKDGRTLYYAAERDGHWGIWKSTIKSKDEKYMTFATEMEEELVTDPSQTCFQPVVSPDGKWLAFLRDRTELVIKDTKSGKEKSLHKDVNYSYQDGDQDFAWSPDSKYILCNWGADGGWNNSDIAVIDIESGEITDLTQSGYSDGDFQWAMGGKVMTWRSDKNGYRSHGSWGAETDVYAMFFDAKTYYEFTRNSDLDKREKFLKDNDKKDDKKDEKKEEKDSLKEVKKYTPDFDGRFDRIVKLTPYAGRIGSHFLTNDGAKLYYMVRLEQGMDLCVLDIKAGSVKVSQKGCSGAIYPAADGKSFFILSSGGVSKVDAASGSKKSISFKGEYEYDPASEREYIFNHIWKQVSEKFYDPTIRGIDWAGYKAEYALYLPHINNGFDFQEMLSEMLGELNGSHTGARFRTLVKYNFGTLGLIYDQSWTGDGLKIKEILPGSPLAAADHEIKAGDVITAVAGKPVKAGEDWFHLFAAKGGRKLSVSVSKAGKKPVDILLYAATSDQEFLYTRWIRQREEMVKKLSGGRIAYVHVRKMNSDSFREVYSSLLGKYRTCEAVIVDTRHNGGGWLHDDLVTLLSGKAYIKFQPRGQYVGTEPYSKWTKPSCVLVGEDNYSDASGFPYVYKTLGIGKVIGAPVPGTMTAVWWETQVDGNTVFGIPQVGSLGLKENQYLENMQLEPDILIYNDPASLLRGEDKQLERAVKEMLKEIQ